MKPHAERMRAVDLTGMMAAQVVLLCWCGVAFTGRRSGSRVNKSARRGPVTREDKGWLGSDPEEKQVARR